MATNPSDEFHPTLGFDGEAHDTLDMIIRNMYGYGVTLTLQDGTEVEGVLGKPSYNDEEDRLEIDFYEVEPGGDYPVAETITEWKRVFASRIQVS